MADLFPFSQSSFMPHGHCYLWTPALVWIEAVSNLLIGLSYVAISTLLAMFVLRVRDLPFRWAYSAFGLFIVSCGFTHFVDMLAIWHPWYWFDAVLRTVTAIASVGTAVLLPRLFPQAEQLAKTTSSARERGIALELAVNDLEDLYRKSLELDQLKTRFFANLSHELRTPLTLIVAPVERLLREGKLDGEQKKELELVVRNARSLLGHVNDLLDIAKLDAHKLEPRFSDTDLSELVHFVTTSFESLARERAITLTSTRPERLRAQLDVDKIQRVLLNLLSNAFKHTPAHGHVHVELTDVQGRAELCVTDDGPGVPEHERETIFQRFQQGQAASAQATGGTGLGLSIVHEFVTLHGGQVSVKDAPGGGASFRVELPLRAPSGTRLCAPVEDSRALIAAAVQELRVPELQEDETADDPERPLVLLVEDNADMRSLLVRTLRDRYRIAQARDGVEGLDKAKLLLPDLIISDVMMPRMNGDALIGAVRAIDALGSVPILMLTASSDELQRVHAIEGGAQDYVLKPFLTDELLARIQNLVTIKRTRDLLQSEVQAQQQDVESLSRQVVAQMHDLSSALDSAREARQHAERASRAKSDFLSLVSHELRTPVTSIQLQLERLRRGVAGVINGEQVHAVEKIARSSGRLLDLLDALLEFGRMESGRLEVIASRVDLAPIARDVIDELRPRADQKGVSLALALGATPLLVQTDERLVRLILVNLIDNAIKYTEQGAIEVRLARTDNGLMQLRVSDTGPGIDPSQQQLIFEPFQQLEHVRHKRGEGVGLGLALVKGLARALNADIALESALGQGSAFIVTLSAA